MYACSGSGEESLDLSNGDHKDFVNRIMNSRPCNNCLLVKVGEETFESIEARLNLIFAYLSSEKGVVCSGKVIENI